MLKEVNSILTSYFFEFGFSSFLEKISKRIDIRKRGAEIDRIRNVYEILVSVSRCRQNG